MNNYCLISVRHCVGPFTFIILWNLIFEEWFSRILTENRIHNRLTNLGCLSLETRLEPNVSIQFQSLCLLQLCYGASKQEPITRSLPSSKPVIHRFSLVPLHTSLPSPLPTASPTSFHTTDLEVDPTSPSSLRQFFTLRQACLGKFDTSFLSLHNKARE